MITGKKDKRRIGYGLGLCIMMMAISLMLIPANVQAAGIDFNAKVMELKTKFPQGKYWNHVGSTADNSDGYTNSPCTLHKTSGVDHVYGKGGCTCNHFAGGGHLLATQCMGFANKLGYDVFGDTTWTVYNNPSSAQVANIQIGDIVRVNNSHSVFVIARTGNNIMVGEANYPGSTCQINWGRIINLTQVTVSYYEHADNYASVMDSAAVTPGGDDGTAENAATEEATTEKITEAPTTEKKEPFTGWKKTSDGKHYQYFKSDKLQKKKWLIIKKKKYYVDKKGYRVTGLYKIDNKNYYFNKSGVLQKKKWVTVDDDIYYVGNDGYVLKKQWLYYKGTLVYVTDDGPMAKNELVKINGKTYYFNSKGKRSKGFKKVKGKYYYCDSKGIIQKKKWVTKSGKQYYLQKSGVRVQSKLVTIGKYKYYFNSKGQLVINKKFTYKKKIYKADKKGHCKFVCNEKITESDPAEAATTETATEQEAAQ